MNAERLYLLIVEDEEAHVEAIRRAFAGAGVNVEIRAVGTLREFRAGVAERMPDLALIDLNLPDGCAMEVLTYRPETALPILVMTAFGTQDIVVQVMKAGAMDYVVKSPEAFAAMPHTLERVFREWKLLQKQKQAEDEIRRLNAELEQRVLDRTAQLEAANQELEAFSYSVSHDLRAPLRGIDGWAQALLADFGDKLGEDGRQLLQRQRTASQRMGALIDDLLRLSQLTRQPLTRQTVSPAAMVSRVWEELRPAQAAQTTKLVLGTLPDCQADSSLLTQVFVNLLGNALKFSGGHAHPRIEVDSQTGPDHECVYFVKDNGAGFDMRYASKLFGAFQRLHDAHEFPGTGIGLAITQRIIRRHGGRIWAESAVGQGATFFFTLREENEE